MPGAEQPASLVGGEVERHPIELQRAVRPLDQNAGSLRLLNERAQGGAPGIRISDDDSAHLEPAQHRSGCANLSPVPAGNEPDIDGSSRRRQGATEGLRKTVGVRATVDQKVMPI